MSVKVAPKWFRQQNERFRQLYKNCLKMWDIWAKWLLPQALKSWPKCNKSPNLVTPVVNTKKEVLWSWPQWEIISSLTSFYLKCFMTGDYVLVFCSFFTSKGIYEKLGRLIFLEDRLSLQCDQMWQKCATLGKFLKYLEIFEGLVFGQRNQPALAKNSCWADFFIL